MRDIYGNSIIEALQINHRYTGIVIYNDNWEKDNTVKVWIKELMPIGYDTLEYATYMNSLEYIREDNGSIVKLNTDILIISKQVEINNTLVKPNINDKVIVEFVDNDVKKCVFYNMNYMEVNQGTVRVSFDKGIYTYDYGNDFKQIIDTIQGKITYMKDGKEVNPNVPDMEE